MFYHVLKSYVRLGLRWYIPAIRSSSAAVTDAQVPSILVANMPNGFLDALVIAAYFPSKLCFVADGQFFKKPIANLLLRQLFTLPVYLRRDCSDYGVRNDFTYDECIRQLKAGRHVLLFPETQPLPLPGEKLAPFFNGGISSILERAYREGIPVQVQPCMLTYGVKTEIPRQLLVDFKPLVDTTEHIIGQEVQSAEVIAITRRSMNQELAEEEAKEEQDLAPKKGFGYNVQNLLAQIGYGLHTWFYKLVSSYVKHRAGKSRNYDGLLFVALLLSYPVLLFLISYIVGRVTGFWLGLFVFIFLPLTAYFMLRFKKADS